MRVIWTFDPFEKNKKLQMFGRDIIKTLFDELDSIEIVYVASNSEVELATAHNIPLNWRYSVYPKKLIKKALSVLDLKKAKIEVFYEKSLSLGASVKKVTSYAKRNGNDLILIATNSKQFLPRLIYGSFAETMVHLSANDLLIYHQNTKFKFKVPKKILYAYDFSHKGSLGLERAITYAKKWNSSLIVTHTPIPTMGMKSDELEKITNKNLQKLETNLKKREITYEIVIQDEEESISENILLTAKTKKVDMIAMAAQANRLETLLGGSVTRKILRSSSNLLLVLKV